jgi:D-3-phosphoglycerate dehydrogenase
VVADRQAIGREGRLMPAAKKWRVARFDAVVNPVFDERLRAEPDIELVVSPAPKSHEDVERALAGARVYHVSSARNEMAQYAFVTETLLARNPHVLAISTYGAGFDSVDVAACTRAGVAVMNQAGANKHSVAEHAIAMILSLVHRIPQGDRRMRTERGFTREMRMGDEAAGMTLGLVGLGHVGTRVAEIARVLGLEVIAADPFLDAAEVGRRGARKVGFDELLAAADIVSLHCPRDEQTIGMMGAAQFARMKKGAFFITTARGGIHDEAALADAMRSGHIAGAGLDVWQPEPPPLDSPLLALDNVIASFHTAGVTHQARRKIAEIGSAQIIEVLRGGRPPRFVNPEVWPAFVERYNAAKARLGI